jgi:gamma-glutamylcyclotransferase (GGCT)/AIG2-like uncharacterized protein YtfP
MANSNAGFRMGDCKTPDLSCFDGRHSISSEPLGHVFVYGSLKAGQSRGGQWPVPPVLCREAWTLGRLYDLGPYPALQKGSDCVLGEVWSFGLSQLPVVHAVLDEIEVTNQPGLDNEYDRVAVEAILADGLSLRAEAYLFADESLLTPQRRIEPWLVWHNRLVAVWPRCSGCPASG